MVGSERESRDFMEKMAGKTDEIYSKQQHSIVRWRRWRRLKEHTLTSKEEKKRQ
jgi:hypothetical protein